MITNHDRKAVFLQNPRIKLPQTIDGDKIFVLPKQKGLS
jgi:hypothetical protein